MESDPKIMMKYRFESQHAVSQLLEQIYRSPVRHGRYAINYQDIESINSTHIYHDSFRTTVCKNLRTRQLRTTHKRKCPLLIHLFQRTKLHLGTRTNTEMKVDRLWSVLVSQLLENVAEVSLGLDVLDPLGIDPHPLDALPHSPRDVRLGSALEKLLRLITMFIGGQLKPCFMMCQKSKT